MSTAAPPRPAPAAPAKPATTSNAAAPKARASPVRLYWRVTAPLLAAVAVVGFVLNLIGQPDLLGRDFLSFDYTHNLVHVLLAALAYTLGYGEAPEETARLGARILGVVYVVLAAVGFGDGALFGVGPFLNLHLEVGENVLHLALGAWGAYVGFRG